LEPESRGSNNLAFCATVFGQIDSLRLAKALDTLAARHPILRACIKEHCGEPGQFVKSRISVPLASLDATNLDPSEFEELLQERVRAAL
jgi:condensation domain-containing protein